MSVLFDFVYLLVAAVTAPWWARKSREWRKRLGRIEALPEPQRARILLHAVSVGEVNLIRMLVDRLCRDVEVVVSATTDTGLARAKQLYGGREDVHVVPFPLDASWAVRRFLDAVRPDAVGLVELELWPNFARACFRRRIPLAIVNGRLSHRSLGRYRLVRPMLGRLFRSLAFCAVQDETYLERFVSVGADPDRCVVAGTMKWDAAEIADFIDGQGEFAASMGIDQARPLIVAGSTAPDEHELLHRATPPGVQLLCAPRKPEWFDDAARDLPGCVRRSDEGLKRTSADRFLLDTIGELRMAYALADIVIVGRSFGELFGSDPMEPAALGKPIVIGPSVADFKTTVDAMLADRAIIQIGRAELAGTLASLIEDEARRRELGERARACVRSHQGATERHAELLLDLIHGDAFAPSDGAAQKTEASHVRT